MLSVRLFGKPEIYLKDEVPVVFPTLQGEAIFCYLLLVKRPVLHTKIASLFWPELPVAAALAAWHKLFSLLQKIFIMNRMFQLLSAFFHVGFQFFQ